MNYVVYILAHYLKLYTFLLMFTSHLKQGYWPQAYTQLANHYNNLAQDCSKAILLRDSLYFKIEALKQENQKLRAKKINNALGNQTSQCCSLFLTTPPCGREITTEPKKLQGRKIVNINKTNPNSVQSRKKCEYQCEYPGCGRSYGSSSSVNLHIKLKHVIDAKEKLEAHETNQQNVKLSHKASPCLQVNLQPNYPEFTGQGKNSESAKSR